jgi:hypothetical protein
MTQAQIDKFKIKNIFKRSISTQTNTNDNNIEFFFNLSKSKHARLHFSESYNDIVLSFNINRSKSFIINRQMWKLFRKNIFKIDKELNK